MHKPTQRDMFYKAGARMTEKHLAMLDLLFGANPITDSELRKSIERRPHVYGCYAGYLGTRVGDGAVYFGA